MRTRLRIAHVASEVSPFSETGGLAQVASALPTALAERSDVEVAVFSPLYPCVAQRAGEALGPARSIAPGVRCGGRSYDISVRSLEGPSGVRYHFLGASELFARDGLYGDVHGEYGDNGIRYGVFCRAVLASAATLMSGPPDLFHGHDWQAGLLAAMAKTDGLDTATVFTIHNLAYQGCVSKSLVPALSLPWSTFTPQGLEFYDQLNMLKAGAAFSRVTTTVSESYSHEIRTPEFGHGLDGFLRYDCPRLVGIPNGLDTAHWNPADDPHLDANYSEKSLGGKQVCRQALLREYGLEADEETLVLGAVSRFAAQKGLDLLAEAVPALATMGAKVVVVGSGEQHLEERFRDLAARYPKTLALHIGYSTAHAHRVFAGADAFVMPSRFEPCGLGQMAAMRYGTPPIVHAVGGLRDTVVDLENPSQKANGVSFTRPTVRELTNAVARAAQAFREPERWREVMLAGMRADWSWASSAQRYMRLYEELVALA